MLLNILYIFFYVLAIVGIFTLAGLVYLRQKNLQNSFFAIFSILLDVWILLQFIAQYLTDTTPFETNLILRTIISIPPFFAVCFYLFAKLYTHKKTKILVHFLAPALFLLATIPTEFVVKAGQLSEEGLSITEVGLLYFPLIGFVGTYIVIGLTDILRERSRRNINAARQQSNLLIGFSVFQALVLTLFMVIFFADSLLSQLVVPVTLFVMVLIFAYAIVRHGLFDIRLALARSLAYILLLFALLLLYAGFAFSAIRLLFGDAERMSLAQELVHLIFAVILAFTYNPLRRLFDRLTDRLFFQNGYNTQEVLARMASIASDEIHLKQVSMKSMKVLSGALKAEFSEMIVYASDKQATYTFSFGTSQISAEGPEMELLVRAKKLRRRLIAADHLEDTQEELQHIFSQARTAVVLRLETSRELVGFLLFGAKQNGRGYNSKDLQLLTTAGDELALAIQNSLRFQEIEEFNRTLQERVDEATFKLRETNKKLRALDEAKDEFISMASHQMRTPLTSVKGYISMILEGYGGPLKPEQRKLLLEAYNSSQRMVYLIADFLSVSRIRTDKFIVEAQPVRLTEIIQDEINQLKITAENRGLELAYIAPSHFPILMLDEEKMRQVIMNLIDNAIYYTRPGGSVTVVLAATDNEVTLRVQDTGIGVPKDEQHKLFGKFFRAGNALKMRPDGTGIGLFLARKIVALQGGAMIFESKEGKGSTFGFSFPRQKISVDDGVNKPGDKHGHRSEHPTK